MNLNRLPPDDRFSLKEYYCLLTHSQPFILLLILPYSFSLSSSAPPFGCHFFEFMILSFMSHNKNGGTYMLKLIVWIQNFLNKIRRDRISAYSGQSAYFIILSALPFILFLLTLVQHLPFTLEMIKDSIFLVIPEPYAPTVTAIFNDIHVESGTTLLSVSVIMTIWTAGKGIMAISGGLNSVQQVEENRPYLILRIKAAVYTLLFAVMIIFTVLVLVFGNRIYLWLQSFMPNTRIAIITASLIRNLLMALLPSLFTFLCLHCFINSFRQNA